MGSQEQRTRSRFRHGFSILNSGPHICIANVLRTELPPLPLFSLLLDAQPNPIGNETHLCSPKGEKYFYNDGKELKSLTFPPLPCSLSVKWASPHLSHQEHPGRPWQWYRASIASLPMFRQQMKCQDLPLPSGALLESFAFLWRQKGIRKHYNNVLSLLYNTGSQMKGLMLCT